MIKDYSFNGQKPGENVVDVVNNHPYVLYPAGFRTIIVLVCVVAVFLFWPSGSVFAVFVGLLVLLYFFNAFYSYKESILIITNQRVFSVAQRGFFKRKIIEVDLDKIQDISSDTQGLTKMFLKYGDLVIRTAGTSQGGEITVKNIPNPYDIQQVIARVKAGH